MKNKNLLKICTGLDENGNFEFIFVDPILTSTKIARHINSRVNKIAKGPACKYCWDKKTYSTCEGGSIAMGDFVGDKPYLIPMKIVQRPCPRCNMAAEEGVSDLEKGNAFEEQYTSRFADPKDANVSAAELDYAIHLLKKSNLNEDEINTMIATLGSLTNRKTMLSKMIPKGQIIIGTGESMIEIFSSLTPKMK